MVYLWVAARIREAGRHVKAAAETIGFGRKRDITGPGATLSNGNSRSGAHET